MSHWQPRNKSRRTVTAGASHSNGSNGSNGRATYYRKRNNYPDTDNQHYYQNTNNVQKQQSHYQPEYQFNHNTNDHPRYNHRNQYNNQHNYRHVGFPQNYQQTNVQHNKYTHNQRHRHYDSKPYRNTNNNHSKSSGYDPDYKYKKSLGYQPRTIGQNSIQYLSKYEFWVTEKSEGLRLVCYITNNNMYFIDREFNLYQIIHPFYTGLGTNTLLDGELVKSQLNNKIIDRFTVQGFIRRYQQNVSKTQRDTKIMDMIFKYFHVYYEYQQLTYLMFDCMVYNNLSVTDKNSSVRFKQIDKFMQIYNQRLISYAGDSQIAKELTDIAVKQNNEDSKVRAIKDNILALMRMRSNGRMRDQNGGNYGVDNLEVISSAIKLPLKFVKKTYYKSTQSDMIKLFSCITHEGDKLYYFTDYKTGRRNKNDGIVFTPEYNDYFMKRHSEIENDAEITRKWKPRELQTIDVKINLYRTLTRDVIDRFIPNNDGILHLFTFDHKRKETIEIGKINVGNTGDNLTDFQQQQRDILKRIYNESLGRNQSLKHLIVECCFNLKHESWEIMHWRSDKTTPNVLKTCQSTWKRIKDPISQTDLINACRRQ